MKWLIFVAALLALLVGVVLFVAKERPASVVAVPADALAVFEDARFDRPVGWQWETLATAAGDVRWGHAGPAAPRGVVLFFPGYSAPLEIYFESFTRILNAGYAVIAMDWPGQGGSSRGSANPQKIHATSLDGHVNAALMLDSVTRDLYSSGQRIVVALSMGAQLGARVIAADEAPFTAAALITPAFGLYGGGPNTIERALLAMLNKAGFGQRYAPGSTDWVFDMDAHEGTASACSHPNARTRLWSASMVRDETLKVGGPSNAFVSALIASAATSRSEAVLQRIEIPVWMPLASEDVFVDNDAATTACAALGTCRLQRYDAAKHCLFEESDTYYQPFMDDLVAFLNAHTNDTL
ncbi:MAG: alpha/beta hydrolase [Pseudomonadota bacterium]